jgi:hypothetical protein
MISSISTKTIKVVFLLSFYTPHVHPHIRLIISQGIQKKMAKSGLSPKGLAGNLPRGESRLQMLGIWSNNINGMVYGTYTTIKKEWYMA